MGRSSCKDGYVAAPAQTSHGMGRASTTQRMSPNELGTNIEEGLEEPRYRHGIYDMDQTGAKPELVATVDRGYHRSSYWPYSKR